MTRLIGGMKQTLVTLFSGNPLKITFTLQNFRDVEISDCINLVFTFVLSMWVGNENKHRQPSVWFNMLTAAMCLIDHTHSQT